MKRLFRVLWIGGVLVAALLVFVGVIGLVYIDSAAKAAIEAGGTYALGVPTGLDRARLRPLAGRFGLDGLTIANPSGFDAAHFLRLNRADVELETASLLGEMVHVPRLELRGITLNLQKKDKRANYDVILENLKRFESADTGQPPPKGGKRFVIDEVTIRDVTVEAELVPLIGKLSQITVCIPEIRLRDVGSESDRGALMAQVSGTVMEAILVAVAEKGAGLLPEVMLTGLGEGLKGIAGVGKLGVQVVGEVTKVVEGVGAAVGGAVGEVGKGVGEAVGKVGKGVGEAVGKVGKGVGEASGKVLEGTGKVLQGLGGVLQGKKKSEPEGTQQEPESNGDGSS